MAGSKGKWDEMIDSPAHYSSGEGIECYQAIKAMMAGRSDCYQSWLQASVMKYIWRLRRKETGLINAKKAQWFIVKLVESLEEEEADRERKTQ
jgi:hypothetical protein